MRPMELVVSSIPIIMVINWMSDRVINIINVMMFCSMMWLFMSNIMRCKRANFIVIKVFVMDGS